MTNFMLMRQCRLAPACRVFCSITSCRTPSLRLLCKRPTCAHRQSSSRAILSFLGAGTPPDVPSWGNIMAEGRTYVMISFWILFFPGVFLTLVVLSVNLLGDGLRDTLDPRLRRSTGSL